MVVRQSLWKTLQKADRTAGCTLATVLDGPAANAQLLLCGGLPVWQNGAAALMQKNLTTFVVWRIACMAEWSSRAHAEKPYHAAKLYRDRHCGTGWSARFYRTFWRGAAACGLRRRPCGSSRGNICKITGPACDRDG